MPGFEVDKSGLFVSFSCPDCGLAVLYLSRSSVDHDRTLRNHSNSCCGKYKASNEIVYALESMDATRRESALEEKLSETKSNFAVYIMFGVVPLILGVLFNSSESITTGIGFTIFVVIFWYFKNR